MLKLESLENNFYEPPLELYSEQHRIVSVDVKRASSAIEMSVNQGYTLLIEHLEVEINHEMLVDRGQEQRGSRGGRNK